MGGIVLALTIGFLLGVLLMVILAAGREDENLLDRVERGESSRRLPVNGSEQRAEGVKQTSGTRD